MPLPLFTAGFVARLTVASVFCAALVAAWHWHARAQYNKGAAAVQARWDAQREADRASALQEALQRNAAARAQEAHWRAQIDQLTQDNHALQTQLDSSRRSARAAERVLHTTIAGLRADLHAAASASAAAPAAAAAFERAAAAAELLSQCAGRYGAVAADADRLSAQVTGLQQYVAGVCQ